MKTITINYPGGSLLDVRKKFSDCFYDQGPFASKKIAAGKWEVSLEPIKESFNKNWSEQQKLVPMDSEIPPVAILTYAICEHFKATGERPFQNVYVRCSDLGSDGYRVGVGSFGAEGLFVAYDWGSDRVSNIGLASARKLETLDELETSENLDLSAAIDVVKKAGYRVIKVL